MALTIGKDFEKNLGKSIEDHAVSTAEAPTPEPQNTEPVTKTPEPTPPIQQNKSLDQILPASIDPIKPSPTPPIIDDKAVLEYFKNKGRQVESMDDLFKVKEIEKEVIKEINPYDDILDEEDKAYFKYKRETGRSRKDFDNLSQDISTRPAIEIARDRVRNETGLTLTNAEVDSYLEETLSIDLTGDLDGIDNIKLNGYAKPYKDQLIANQDKYRKPLEESLRNKSQQQDRSNMVKLATGEEITNEEYQQRITNDRNLYIENITKAVNSVTASDFKIEIDDNGEKRNLDFTYEYSNEDRHSMLSEAKDIDAMIERRYKTKDNFNHQSLAEDVWWGVKANRQKVISAAMQQSRAQAIEEMTARDNNQNFSRPALQQQPTDDEGYGSLTGKNNTPGFGVKFAGFGQ